MESLIHGPAPVLIGLLVPRDEMDYRTVVASTVDVLQVRVRIRDWDISSDLLNSMNFGGYSQVLGRYSAGLFADFGE